MKPEQFIRKYGVENVKTLIENYEKDQFAFKSFDPAADCCFDAGLCMGQEKAWWDICIYDLKRLVESLDLVQLLGGIDALNGLLDMANSPFSLSGITRDEVFYSSEKIKELAQVHESIYGGGDE